MKNLVILAVSAFVVSLPGFAMRWNGNSATIQKEEVRKDYGRSTSSVRENFPGAARDGKMVDDPHFKNSNNTPTRENEVIDMTGHDTNGRFIP